jgi:hypothetical protein
MVLMMKFRVPVIYNSNYEVDLLGNVYRIDTGRMLKQHIYKGYNKVFLSSNNTGKWYSVHRIVLASFKGFSKNKFEVNHIDGNKQNNKLDNLEWCTRSENAKHAIKLNLKHQGAKEVICYDKDMNYLCKYKSCADVERKLGIEHSLVSRCCRGIIKHVHNYIFKYSGNIGKAEVI